MISSHVRFDSNEWALLGFVLLNAFLVIKLPRRFPFSIMLTMLVFSGSVARIFDHMLAGPAMHDLYDIMDRNKIEWSDLVTYVMYAPPGYIFVYLYDRWNLSGMKIPAYVLAWSLLSTGIEWLLSLANVFVYKEWSLAHSFLVYLFVQPLTLLVFEFLKRRHSCQDI